MESQENYVIISRKEAKLNELYTYYTGIPCKHGHISPRKVCNCGCIACQEEYYQNNRKSIIKKQMKRNSLRHGKVREYQKQYRKDNADKRAQYSKDYYQANREEQIKKSREHKAQNKEYYKEYNIQYYANNKEQILEYSRKYNKEHYQKNKEEINRKTLERYHNASSERIEQRKETKRKYRESEHGSGILNACGAKRRCQKLNATPPWYEHEKVTKLYEESARLTRETGVQYNVDHIVPLQNKLVSGLHCLANLQIITKEENLKKHNKFERDI